MSTNDNLLRDGLNSEDIVNTVNPYNAGSMDSYFIITTLINNI